MENNKNEIHSFDVNNNLINQHEEKKTQILNNVHKSQNNGCKDTKLCKRTMSSSLKPPISGI